MATISTSINEHKHPAIYRRFPFLLRLQHWFMIATTLRTWYTLRELRTRFKALTPSFRYLDAGFGSGDMILPFLKRYPRAEFVGIDRAQDNADTCQRYADFIGAKNATFVCRNIEEADDEKPYDMIACITVLQYIKDDLKALRRFHDSLVPGGHLVLYSPINYRRYFDWYTRLRKNAFRSVDYDTLQGIQHHYSTEELKDKLEASGFELEKTIFSYGNAGRISYEMQSTVMLSMQMLPNWLAPIYFALGLILVYPITLIFMIADFLLHNKEGNGVLIVAKRPE
ncbi:class I SAM-dependent methyltransferase [bacterium]|nr:class I SAM-dependent methyltransferase [bacterium]